MALLETVFGTGFYVLSHLVDGLALAVDMAWDTWWALVLGFTITGAVDEFVGEDTMTHYLGDDGVREAAYGTLFGAASSSCSFSAVATAKTLFKKGASPVTSLGAFQFAATDLVVELGLVMWILLGWQFVAADFFGGIVAVAVLVFVLRQVPDSWWDAARQTVLQLDESTCAACGMTADPTDEQTLSADHDDDPVYLCCSGCLSAFEARQDADLETGSEPPNLRSLTGWRRATSATVREWDMLWEDIAIGFLVAGIVGAFVPRTWWTTLFGTGDGFGFVLQSALVAVVIAVLTFVCSVGNVPFALVLWTNGIAFGSVLTFIFADLIIPPIVNTYRRYYGWRIAAVLFVGLALAAVVAGVTVHYTFDFLSVVPHQGETGGTVGGGYTLALNLVFTPLFLLQLGVAAGAEATGEKLVSVSGLTFLSVLYARELAGRLSNVSRTFWIGGAAVVGGVVTLGGGVFTLGRTMLEVLGVAADVATDDDEEA